MSNIFAVALLLIDEPSATMTFPAMGSKSSIRPLQNTNVRDYTAGILSSHHAVISHHVWLEHHCLARLNISVYTAKLVQQILKCRLDFCFCLGRYYLFNDDSFFFSVRLCRLVFLGAEKRLLCSAPS